MNKRFIVLIDFSEGSANLLKYAYEWSAKIGAELLLVHQIVDLIPSMISQEEKNLMLGDLKFQKKEELKQFAANILSENTPVTFLVTENNLIETLNDLLRKSLQETLIFIGLKGTGYFKKILVGSEAAKITEKIYNNIVAVPVEVSMHAKRKIYVGISDLQHIDIIEFNKFLKFLDESVKEIHFIYISKENEDTFQIEKILADLLDFYKDRFETDYKIWASDDYLGDLREMLKYSSEEILVLQYSTNNFIRNAVKQIIYDGSIPIVVLP